MIKQFLLNADGSIPHNINIDALNEAGIKLVMPTEPPRESGMIPIEQEAVLIDGVWFQSWKLEPQPEPVESLDEYQ